MSQIATSENIPPKARSDAPRDSEDFAVLLASLADFRETEGGSPVKQAPSSSKAMLPPKLALKEEKVSESLNGSRYARPEADNASDRNGEKTAEPLANEKKGEEEPSNEDNDAVTGEKRKRTFDDDWRPGGTSVVINKKKAKKVVIKKKPTKVKKEPVSNGSSSMGGGDDKMSFQEAAVQVLAEQREKGVYALSTRKIWELISQSGLVDTKCKTPVSSLSSRITEDVRTKGNKSVFVRVGEGLYTLRKGMKRQDLEKYLNAKYPNINHAAKFDSKSSDEEIEEEKEINHEEERDDEQDEEESEEENDDDDDDEDHEEPPSSSHHHHHSHHQAKPSSQSSSRGSAAAFAGLGQQHFASKLRQHNRGGVTDRSRSGLGNLHSAADSGSTSTSGSAVLKPCWVGLPLKTKCNGDVYYTSVKADKHIYRVGDCAYFTPNSDDLSPYIGQITKLWQSNSKATSASHNSQMLVQCVWYYYPEDTHCGRTKKHHKQEVFLSELSDVNSVNSLLSPAEVVSFPEYSKRVNSNVGSKKELKDLYFCRAYYDENTQTFHPLQIDYDTGRITIEGIHSQQQQKAKSIKNWPQELEYTDRAIWKDIPEVVKELLQSKDKPSVAILAVTPTTPQSQSSEGEKGHHATNALEHFGVFATRDIEAGTILGEYTGYVVNNTSEADDATATNTTTSSSINSKSSKMNMNNNNSNEEKSKGTKSSSPFFRTLFEDHEVLVSIDSANAGNQFRFMRDTKATGKAANVRLASVFLDGAWHLLVLAQKPVGQGEELVMDYGLNNYWPSSSKEPPTDTDEEIEDEEKFDTKHEDGRSEGDGSNHHTPTKNNVPSSNVHDTASNVANEENKTSNVANDTTTNTVKKEEPAVEVEPMQIDSSAPSTTAAPSSTVSSVEDQSTTTKQEPVSNQ